VTRLWKVGELARRTGLSVRTLHHYDEIGLLSPSHRTPSGHRQYAEGDVARLQQIVSLRSLGLPLEEIRGALDRRGLSLAEVVRLHAARLREQLDMQRRLVERLEAVAAGLDRAEGVSAEELIRMMEMIRMYEKYYTPEQMEQIKARGEAYGQERIRQFEAEWAQLIADVQAEMDRGTDPADPRVQAMARRWMELVNAFTGGDPGIARAVGRMWQEEEQIHGIDTANMRRLGEYIGRAQGASQSAG
jgi:DNA-binding transcriptional MerR regulator